MLLLLLIMFSYHIKSNLSIYCILFPIGNWLFSNIPLKQFNADGKVCTKVIVYYTIYISIYVIFIISFLLPKCCS